MKRKTAICAKEKDQTAGTYVSLKNVIRGAVVVNITQVVGHATVISLYQAKDVSGKDAKPLTSSVSVWANEGTFQSEPVIKVYGSGDIKLKINDGEVTVKKVDGYVTVDSVLKDCCKDDALKM